MDFYIDYLDSKNNFRENRKYFKTYSEAYNFMLENFDKVSPDFIKTN